MTETRTIDSPPYSTDPAGFDTAAFRAEMEKAMEIAAGVKLATKTPAILQEHPPGSGVKILMGKCPHCKAIFGMGLDPEKAGASRGKMPCQNCWKWLDVEHAG